MNLEALRILCEVVREQSFSKAGKRLGITQSAASQAVQSLERELGCQLIDRSRRPLQLTLAGEEFHLRCLDIVQRIDDAVLKVREIEEEVSGAVPVASIYSIGLYHTEEVRQFLRAYPKATIRLQYLRPNLVYEAVHSGDAMLGLVSYPAESDELATVAWKREKMVLVTPPRHKLASAGSIKLTQISGERFVAFDADMEIRKQIDAILKRHQTDVRIVTEFDNIETIKQAVQIGAGISILPEAAIWHAQQSGALGVATLDPADFERPLGAIFRKNRPLPLAARKFLELLSQPKLSKPDPSKPDSSKPASRVESKQPDAKNDSASRNADPMIPSSYDQSMNWPQG